MSFIHPDEDRSTLKVYLVQYILNLSREILILDLMANLKEASVDCLICAIHPRVGSLG